MFGGITTSEARCLKELTQENSKLKRLLAELMLDNSALTRRLESRNPAGQARCDLNLITERAMSVTRGV